MDRAIGYLRCVDFGRGPSLAFFDSQGLWVSDGRPAGTVNVRRLGDYQGIGGADVVRGRLLFLVDRELWSSDGTAPGTRLVRTLAPSNSPGIPMRLLANVAGTEAYFWSENLTALWKTDGTTAGTVRVSSVRADTARVTGLMVRLNGGVVFAGGDTTHGVELWRTDGTAQGTRMLRDINPGPLDSGPALAPEAIVGGYLYFSAEDGVTGRELWRTDGTAAGTRRVLELVPGIHGGAPYRIKAIGNRFYFGADLGQGSEPYVYDGNRLVSLGDLEPGPHSSFPRDFTPLGQGGRVVFAARTSAAGDELYVTDGTAAGTVRIDIEPGVGHSSPAWFQSAPAGGLLFAATDSGNGRELWQTDGTASGTRLFHDVRPGTTTVSSRPVAELASGGGALYLFAQDGPGGPNPHVLRNGRVNRLGQLANHWKRYGHDYVELDRGAQRLTFFQVESPRGAGLWVTDGTASGTRFLRAMRKSEIIRYGDRVYFQVYTDRHGYELWTSDGTVSGTRLVVDLIPGPGTGGARLLRVWGRRLVFVGTGASGMGIWTSDGTAAGTRPLHLVSGFNTIGMVVPAGDRLFFSVGGELWLIDGSRPSARRVAIIGPAGGLSRPAVVGSKLVFVGPEGASGGFLWVSDGTTAGTRLLRRILPGREGAKLSEFCVSGSRLYFSAAAWTSGSELWVTDGTSAGTRLVRDLEPGLAGSDPASLVAAGDGGVYFSAKTSLLGRELFYSDGTAAGTVLVCDLAPGVADGNIRQVIKVGDDLILFGRQERVGDEVFRLRLPGRARVIAYGQDCGAFTQTLRASDPALGRTAQLRGSMARPGVPGVVLIGCPSAQPSLLPRSPGCHLLLDPARPHVVAGAVRGPAWQMPLPIPNDPGLNGRSAVAQGVMLTQSPSLLTSTNAVRLVLGR